MSVNERPSVLVVDDTAANLALMSELLRGLCRVRVANHGTTALKLALQQPQPDLILLDVMMPDLDGYEVCKRLQASPETKHIPVIFLTAKTDTADEAQGFALGAVDYIAKPINPPILTARVMTHIELKRARDALRRRNSDLEAEVEQRIGALMAMQDVTIQAMAALAETRDNETGAHVLRTRDVVRCLAERLSRLPKYQSELDDETIRLIYKSAPLHDIGKIGIPDSILLKNGPLTPAEFEIMKDHARIGRDAIRAAAVGQDNIQLSGFLRYAEEIAYGHHEKFDGSGYPQRLSGDAIPLSARIMAVSDVYDALISRRIYKAAWSHHDALMNLVNNRGKHFDPDIVDAMVAIEDDVLAISDRFRDPEPGADQLAAAG